MEDLGTVLVSKFGLMVHNMLETGKTIGLMVKVNLFMSMETYMKVNGLMIKQTATEYMYMSTALDMKVHGKTIFSMARARRAGLMAQSTWGDTKMVRSMVEVSIAGVMVVNMMDSGLKIK